MSRKSHRTNVKPQMLLIKETIYKTKKFFNKSFTNLKSFIPKKPPKTPSFSSINMINPKLHEELDDFYKSFSEKWDSIDLVKTKEGQLSPKAEQISSMTYSGCLEESKEEKTTNKESSFLAQKMKELEMMNENDLDNVMDVEEVLHYYSRLTCPPYIEIVDKFFMDMYSEFDVTQPLRSANGSMRRFGSASVHSSMRSLGPLRL